MDSDVADYVKRHARNEGLHTAAAICREWQQRWGGDARRTDIKSRADALHAMAAAAAILAGLIADEVQERDDGNERLQNGNGTERLHSPD